MRDPKSENIDGLKQHSFRWDVDLDVGTIALAVAIVYLTWRGAKIVDRGKDEVNTEFTNG